MIEWGTPWGLWVGLPLIGLLAVFWSVHAFRGTGRAPLLFSSIDIFQFPHDRRLERIRFGVQSLRFVTLALLVIASARPQIQRAERKVYAEGIDIMLAVDTSGSMQALDLDANKPIRLRRTRLQVVRDVVSDFVQRRPGDQIGLVVFGEWAFTQCPLSLDHQVLAKFISELVVGVAGRSTAIGDAIGIAIKRLRESKAKSRILVLLTDGQNTAGQLDPQKAAKIAKTYGIRIYTVGAGTRGEAPVIQNGLFGPQVTQIEASIDDEALGQIAETTGGTYFRAEDSESLEEVYAQIDALERSQLERNTVREYEDRYAGWVLAALILLLIEIGLRATWLRVIP